MHTKPKHTDLGQITKNFKEAYQQVRKKIFLHAKICFPLKCQAIYLQLINKYDLFIQVPLIPGKKLCTGCRKHITQTRAPSPVLVPSSSTTSSEESACEPETEEIDFVNINDLNESLSPLGISPFKTLFLFAPTQNFQDLEKSACGCNPKTRKTRGGPMELSTDISALCPLQDPGETYLRPR